jgi:hypothetical protein
MKQPPARPRLLNPYPISSGQSNGEEGLGWSIVGTTHRCYTAPSFLTARELSIESSPTVRPQRPPANWPRPPRNRKARERAGETLALVRDAMKIDYPELRS